jgi:hypothetical protein
MGRLARCTPSRLTLHLLLECQPLVCLNRFHDLVVGTVIPIPDRNLIDMISNRQKVLPDRLLVAGLAGFYGEVLHWPRILR